MIGVAGALGALSRYGLSNVVSRIGGGSFPWGTLCVNLIGCFLIGLIMHISLNTDIIPTQWRTAVVVGFLGALTTFSSFSYETIGLIEKSAYGAAAGNIAVNVIAGLAATIAGFAIGKLITN
jgi:CrcB protein